MNAKNLWRIPVALWDHVTAKLRCYLESRTRRQRIAIVLVLLALFVLLDIWVIANAFYDGGPLPSSHLEPVKP